MLEKFKQLHKLQEKIPVDWILHFSISYVIMGICFLMFNIPILLSATITLMIGLFKESYVDDVFSGDDLKSDIVGIIFFMICAM